MTGFAAIGGETDGMEWRWDVRTVNGRGLDMRLRLPAGFEHVEPGAREHIAAALTRGSCQANLQVRRQLSGAELRINDQVLERVLALIGRIREAGEMAPPRVDGILAIKGVLEIAEPDDSDDERDRHAAALLAGLDRALARLGEGREREGAGIARSLATQLAEIASLVLEIAALPTRSRQAQLDRLRGQLERLLETGIELSSERLHQEAALLATKVDIREELDRLNAHVEAAQSLIEGDGAVGRRLDFLAQELNREANTVCAKSVDIETTRLGLELKAVIDQFREQVQNVE
jgi:uncharacterized protein (TIGR00255 family)